MQLLSISPAGLNLYLLLALWSTCTELCQEHFTVFLLAEGMRDIEAENLKSILKV